MAVVRPREESAAICPGGQSNRKTISGKWRFGREDSRGANMTVVGWDIGGANLKQSTSDGRAWSTPFELWRHPDRLADHLRSMLARVEASPEAVAVTMTGELADCFATKAEGVAAILKAAQEAAAGCILAVWSTDGTFLDAAAARAMPLKVAAANWHALATWTARWLPAVETESGPTCGLLIDIGSTTTDIIPLIDGRPAARGLTDPERLQSGELLYTGVRRTPLAAILSNVAWRGCSTPVAAEWFATTYDVYLLLGELPEDEQDRYTANGRPATKAAAHDRLARMLCADRWDIPFHEALLLARQWAREQERLIAGCVRRVVNRLPGHCQALILSGSGEFLARRVIREVSELDGVESISLTQRLGAAVAASSAAAAVASLLAEQLGTAGTVARWRRMPTG
jgi:hypothetical protein